MKWVRKVGALIIVLVVFFFIGRALYLNWTKIPFGELSFNVYFLLVSFIFQISYFTFGTLGWVLVLKNLGERITLWKALQIHAVSQLGRYVPGKFMAPLGKVYLAKREGIPAYKTLVSIVLETVLGILSALLIFSISIFWLVDKGLPNQMYFALLFIPLCLIVLHPNILPKIVNWGLKRLKKTSIKFSFNYARILQLLGVYCLSWIVQGTCFYFLIRSFFPITLSTLLPLLGINSIAWTVGFLAFIVPGGLGIREGILSFLLKFSLPTSVGIIAAVLWRIWAIIGMLVFATIFSRGLKKAGNE